MPVIPSHPQPPVLTTLAEQAAYLIMMGYDRSDEASYKRQTMALRKAWQYLTYHDWYVDQGELRIQSATKRSQYYVTDGTRCECVARHGICWHRSAWQIISVLAAALGLVQHPTQGWILNLPSTSTDAAEKK